MLIGVDHPRYEQYLVFTSKSTSARSKIAGMKELATIYDRFLKNDPLPASQAPDTRQADILNLPKAPRNNNQERNNKRGLHGLDVNPLENKRKRGDKANPGAKREKIAKTNPPLTNNQTSKVWPVLDSYDFPHCCLVELVSLALAGTQTFACQKDKCKEFHIGDCVKGSVVIPPPCPRRAPSHTTPSHTRRYFSK